MEFDLTSRIKVAQPDALAQKVEFLKKKFRSQSPAIEYQQGLRFAKQLLDDQHQPGRDASVWFRNQLTTALDKNQGYNGENQELHNSSLFYSAIDDLLTLECEDPDRNQISTPYRQALMESRSTRAEEASNYLEESQANNFPLTSSHALYRA